MKAKKRAGDQGQFLLPGLAQQLDARQPLYKLANEIPWQEF